MIVGHKTERFITVHRHTDPAYGFLAIGNEVVTALHATKGWRRIKHRRQIIGPCKKRDVARARAAGSSTTFDRQHRRMDRAKIHPIPITEKMQMRHWWYRKKKAWDAFRASLPEENRL